MLTVHVDLRASHIARLAPAVAICLSAVALPSPLRGEDYKKDIQKAWADREAQVGDLVMSVTMETMTATGALNGKRGHDPTGGDSPAHDLHAARRVTLSVSGELRRLEYEGETFNSSEQARVPEKGVLVVQQGGEVRKLAEYEPGGQTRLQGTITSRAIELEELRNRPMLDFCRPPIHQLDDFSVTGLGASDDGGETIELTSADGARVLVVDPGRDYSIVRYSSENGPNGGLRNRGQLEVEYARDKTPGWAPKRWVATHHRRGRLVSRCVCEVEACRTNASLDPGLFCLAFPSGAQVFDLLDPNMQVRYLYSEGGQRREIGRTRLARPTSAAR
ncbi:hypothetical protein Pla175_32490 [Pirellulimonas nuda]|uniref:Uncharacterized protein n=1 Tax=Pirellulimonas nuda TaxID=2528009 RepID=A0A518DEF6_9BACT|nr:hypothetical protein [Pirellulimonas nuda]QDU89853.1 hypothetical protein Pla175_32490 [Pirellulimonas nuda]